MSENPAFKYSLGNFGEPEQLCHRVKLVGSFLNLRCNYGEIKEIPNWGVYQLGSIKELENTCDGSNQFGCDKISSKSHPIYAKLQKCIGKSECMIEELPETIPL